MVKRKIIKLKGKHTQLVLEHQAKAWCCVKFVEKSGRILDLGADDEDTILVKLLSTLRGPLTPIAGVINGVKVSWVLSLSERHGSIYAGKAKDILILFLENGDGDIIGQLELSPRDIPDWMALLTSGFK